MNAIGSFDPLKISEIPEPGPGLESEFELKFDHQILSNVEVENISQTPTLKTNREKIDSNQSIDQSKNLSNSKSIESNESNVVILLINSRC